MGTLGTGERSSNARQGGQDAGVCLCMKGLCQLCEGDVAHPACLEAGA